MYTEKDIIDLAAAPERFDEAARWFHEKWKVPLQAYLDSMRDSVTAESGVPRWYVMTDGEGRIIAGLGVIENDFHKRPDLAPNICAVYVEKEYRRRGIARLLLDHACGELARRGIGTAYLITSHTDFYEHCGWTFYCMAEENDGGMIRVYRHMA